MRNLQTCALSIFRLVPTKRTQADLPDPLMDQQRERVKQFCNHPLRYGRMKLDRVITDRSNNCDGCGDDSGYGYYCDSCNIQAHVACIGWPDIINHPCHSRHPLKKVSPETIDYTDGKCQFCRSPLVDLMYHCSICNFSVDLRCWLNPAPLTIYKQKSHNHTLTLMARKDSFTCNACGLVGDRNPYVCLQCDYMLHKGCINLPRVININRHDHKIYRTYHLGHGDWECGVCRQKMDWTLGAFSCSLCPNYAVHSKCATREDVWDGKELEDKPEDKEEEDPYKVINEKEIIHFSHEEHNLRLGDDDNAAHYEKMRCDACIMPINSDPFFKCVECEFFLHKVCANLPRKKRNILHNHKLALVVYNDADGKHFKCTYCLQHFDGFGYKCRSYYMCLNLRILSDIRCSSISEPFQHELHPHPLFRTSNEPKTCGACGEDSEYVLSCIVCQFTLGMECATLPRKVKHRCDDHVLSLHHGAGRSNGQLWCDICEGKTDPSVWYYSCDDCGVTLHINCVLGDMNYFKPGNKYLGGELVPNDDSTVVYACSRKCAYRGHDRWEEWYDKVNCE
ncbi:uncharacterized protein LOC110225912 [Arabidopsis lyrata subsp. lyrata]|uniref:uncharacterized protein LOC110225912 n=1 Tax=Arabidopsis lyrata subsp. lyrata TaxID=81972 RepID=UPI000A29B10E|nr:uncharacterized protein LOC110225912 [Arabidopsis lyrata subsp. lyrata]|eukprot:XP_020871921.1 uncharacterized protein LOC110225912 [Arabidopsis lyrata subsp. lyrata]